MIRLSKTSKLNTIRGFAISNKSCTFATELCKLYCYAKKGNFRYEHVRTVHEENYQETLKDSFVEDMIKQLSKNERFFRIHVKGDFYSLEYFNKWVQIAERVPYITFMAYTRNIHVLQLNRPKNLKILITIDDASKHTLKGNFRKAIIGPSKLKKLDHALVFTHNGQQTFLCNSDNCIECLHCWESETNVMLPQKYSKYDKEV